MTTVLSVAHRAGSYDVVIGSGVLEEAGRRLSDVGVSQTARIFLITDETVRRLGYADAVADSCRSVGYTVGMLAVPPGDASKSLDMMASLYNAMLDAGIRRNGLVLAVGGGMVGDLAGFVAATYLRGIPFIQIPTTLLAHDSSIGGKVGVNLPRGKNLIGAFHSPLAVWYDTNPLRSLPSAEWQGGMAEMIKHGIIGDPNLFQSLRDNPMLTPPARDRLEATLARACSVKIGIVEQDEQEQGLRMLLNFGHTVGHAVELASAYALNHGFAVSIGMSVESQLAYARGWLTEADRTDIQTTLSNHGLPILPPAYDLDLVFEIMGLDKKHNHQGWTFALPRAVGRVEIARDVTPDEVRAAWHATGRA